MISYFKQLKTKNKKYKAYRLNAGMTYVELIVVLSIFGIMTAVSMFNYGTFQKKVDIKVLANDIALQIVQAQKDAISGKLLSDGNTFIGKPSYGVYFDTASPYQFIYFADTDNSKTYDTATDEGEQIDITKGNKISGLGDSNGIVYQNLSIVFTRPDSGAVLYAYDVGIGEIVQITSGYAQIDISSADGSVNSNIKVYPSGRIQIN